MNTIVLMGRLARDPETKLTSTQKGQTKVSRFPLVVKRNRTGASYASSDTAHPFKEIGIRLLILDPFDHCHTFLGAIGLLSMNGYAPVGS